MKRGKGSTGRRALTVILAGLFLLRAVEFVSAAEPALPDLLPAATIACIVPPDEQAVDYAYSSSLFRRLAQSPEMAGFLRSLDESHRAVATDLATLSGIAPELAWDIINARLGGALIDVGVDRDGKPRPEFLIVLQLRSAPDRQQVFNAVRTQLNRRDVVKMALESQGMDPNLPIKTLAQEETLPGYPPMLRIGPNIRVTVVGRMILLYNGPGADGIRNVFDAARNPTTSLAASSLYQSAWRGAEADPGTSFTYVNVPRMVALLDAAGFTSVTRVADAIGLASAQAIGLAGGYQAEGMRHNLYVHSPTSGPGLLAALLPMPPNSTTGMEVYSQITPAQAEAFMALRLDLQAFLQEAPYFAEAVGGISRPGGMSSYLANETILGVPLRELAAVLGDDLVIRPHDDTQIILFSNIDVAGFERLAAKMEQTAGARFRTLDVGGYTVRYFNQLADAALPLAPAFCLIPKQQPAGRGVLYVATHPQAVVSLIREAAAATTPLSKTSDYMKATQGLGGGYSLFYYADCRESYRRFYNFMLPMASLWASAGSYPVDTGLLPTASSVMPGLFGCAIGVKKQPQGLMLQAYSPVGINALFIVLADKLVITNPLVLGYVRSWAQEFRASVPW